MKRLLINIIIIISCCAAAIPAAAQSLAAQNAAKRREINGKRSGVNPKLQEGLPASREFIRIDSTYYVGWMFQGIYFEEHAADYLGYKNAALPLEKALDLLERDYKKELRTRNSDLAVYFPVYSYQIDYSLIAYTLFQCYQNSNQDEKSYALLRRVQRWNMQREFFLTPYTMLAWVTHRNRFYTSSKYFFLKNSIPENEQLANRYLDSALVKIKNNAPLNATIFPLGYLVSDHMNVYHYKCMLYSYALNIDSAEAYYELMREGAYFPYNNYGTFCAIQGKFGDAYSNYEIASTQDAGDKRLQEWAYYSSILDIYKGAPLNAAMNMKSMIRAAGSTPGFGWYNIALARACNYEGNIDESERYIDKAANFKEVHIGTTLGQTHYEFSVNMVRLMNKIKRIQQQKFENRNWWWSPSSWYRLTVLNSEKYLQQYLIVNQFAMNPERDMVVYKLFSTESTISWDEIWFLIRDFSTNFFYQKFEQELKQDKRERISKYFNLYLARLDMKKGNYKLAQERLQRSLSLSSEIDEEHEKLYLARVLEALATCAEENNNKDLYARSIANLYTIYPQLLPYSTLKPQMKLYVSGAGGAVLKSLKKYNIDWSESNTMAPKANLVFANEGNKKSVSYSVTDYYGNTIVPNKKIIITDEKQAVKDLAYGLFNIQSLDAQADVEARK